VVKILFETKSIVVPSGSEASRLYDTKTEAIPVALKKSRTQQMKAFIAKLSLIIKN
jgi:hypothetical protein